MVQYLLVHRTVSKAYRMMEAALARGMDQPDAWNATSVEWVRTAKVSKSLVFNITCHSRA